MPQYAVLLNFTDQLFKSAKEISSSSTAGTPPTPRRA
jgi:uncharacterized protein with GYD domain